MVGPAERTAGRGGKRGVVCPEEVELESLISRGEILGGWGGKLQHQLTTFNNQFYHKQTNTKEENTKKH